MNAIHLAVIGGCDTAVELLLAAGDGAGADMVEQSGLLPLHLACRYVPKTHLILVDDSRSFLPQHLQCGD